jgi:GT2 family glycosyltransferase
VTIEDRFSAEGRLVAPPVVAVMVVNSPGDWFDETLDSLARQDYPNLNTLFLVAGGDDAETAARIRRRLPSAFVRVLEGGPVGGPGFGPAANAVFEVVEGASGLLCFCHDDIALSPGSIRTMVEELYRSNAAIVGPKLVSWDNPSMLQDVGLDVDRFGASASRVEVGEYDQQQHDAAVEVFAVPSACMLVRADLFQALGGFDTAMRYHGEDVDLCWRARISGARVAVAPAARVRHRGELELRRPDLNHKALRARHQMRSAMTLTPGAQLPLRLIQFVALTLAELVGGAFVGRFGEGWAALRALVGSIPRFPTFLARRGAIAKLRRAGRDNAAGLQSAGSNRLRAIGRAREMRTLVGVDETVRRWREGSVAPLVTWISVIVAVLLASRTFINSSVPVIGEFLRLPDRAADLWSGFTSAWDPNRLGETAPNPTGLGVLAVSSITWLLDMSAGMTVLIIGLILLGALGVWRLADLFPSNRERVVALVTYTAMPLLPGVISTGRLGPLVAYAVVPWFVHLVRVAIGIATADPASAVVDLPDGLIAISGRERLRRGAVAALVVALGVAVAPPLVVVLAGVAIVLGLASLLVGSGWRTAAWMAGTGLAVVAVAWLLNVPASLTWTWDGMAAVPLAGPPAEGLADILSMDIGGGELGSLSIALYIPVLAGLVLAKAWRLTWAARAAGLVVAFGLLAVLQDRGDLPVRLPEVGFLLAPVALGLSIAAACAVASFVADIRGGSFGWRQPAGLIAIGAVGVGMFPSLLTLTDGSWYAPSTTLTSLLAPQIAPDAEFGDFRVLYVGDPRVMPGAPVDLGDGVAMQVTAPGEPAIADRWVTPTNDGDDALAAALDDIAGNVTQRGGRLLAPYGIRYVVVPVYDGAESTPDEPVNVPAGLIGALGSQLDLELRHSPPNYVLFENHSAFPGAALFTGDDATAAGARTPAELVATDLSGGTAALGTVLDDLSGSGAVDPGVLALAVPFDDRWTLEVDGQPVAARQGFGVMTAFDVPAAGQAELRYDAPGSRRLALLGQALLWLVALFAASRVRLPGWLARSGRHVAGGHELIDLDHLTGDERGDSTGDDPTITIPMVRPSAASGPDVGRPLFDDDEDVTATIARLARGDAERPSTAWVDDLFDGDDDGDDGGDDDGDEVGDADGRPR